LEVPTVIEAHWARFAASVADVTKCLVVFRGDHPTFPLEVLVYGVVEVHGGEEGLMSPNPTIILLRSYVLVLAQQLWVVFLYAPRA
jgi:hypothetical protein